MTRERRNPFGIHETEEGKRLLGEIREKLRQQGLGIAQFHQHGNDELIQFDIMQGLWVYNHGERQTDIQCIACPNHPALQYEFIIHDLQGAEHRPIGSTCILKRSLGEAEAERYGKRLQSIARQYFKTPRKVKKQEVRRSQHQQEHAKLLHESGNVRAYLKALGLDWLSLAAIQSDEWVVFTAADRATVNAVIEAKRPFTEEEYLHFQELHRQRLQQQSTGFTLADERSQQPLPKQPVRSLLPAKRPHPKKLRKQYFDKLKFEKNPTPLSEEMWPDYLAFVGYDYNETDWLRVGKYLPPRTVQAIRKKMSRHIPLSEGDINALKRADQLWRRSKNKSRTEQSKDALYRAVPLTDEEAVQQVIGLLQRHLFGDGYKQELQLFQNLADIPAWVEKFLSYDVSRVRIQEVAALSGGDLRRVSQQLSKHHDWQP